jgi:hypothetical protein
MKRFFHYTLVKIAIFFVRLTNNLSTKEFKNYLTSSINKERSIISPIGMDLRLLIDNKKQISLYLLINQNINDKKTSFVKMWVYPLKISFNTQYFKDYIYNNFEDLNSRLGDNLRNINFVIILYDKLVLKFSPLYSNCNNIYDVFISRSRSSYFYITKKFNQFHLISNNQVCFIIDFLDNHYLRIYSK